VAEQTVLILDFGSQFSQLIARRVREAKVYCELVPGTTPWSELKERDPAGLILSGGPSSVYEEGAPQVDEPGAGEIEARLGPVPGEVLRCEGPVIAVVLVGELVDALLREAGARCLLRHSQNGHHREQTMRAVDRTLSVESNPQYRGRHFGHFDFQDVVPCRRFNISNL